MNCKHFKRRSKNYKHYLYCNKLKKEITFDNCKGCEYKEYKERKPVKNVSKKRVTVSNTTYNQVYEDCNGRCALCFTTQNLQYHHILYRSERKDLIDEASNGIILCLTCHTKIHSNKKKYQPILLEIKK